MTFFRLFVRMYPIIVLLCSVVPVDSITNQPTERGKKTAIYYFLTLGGL